MMRDRRAQPSSTACGTSPIDRLRSIVLTLLSLGNVTIAFAALYALQGSEALSLASDDLNVLNALYYSVGTFPGSGTGEMAAVGYAPKITGIAQISVGVYFVAAIFSSVVQWADAGRKRKRKRYGPTA
jgi:hypothetical protein